MLAYYYQWFSKKSWDRAKVDYPLAGRYSSDDVSVMQKQIEQAKSAGIDGFIVSLEEHRDEQPSTGGAHQGGALRQLQARHHLPRP